MQRNADATRWGWDARGGRQRWFWRWRSDARKVHASAAADDHADLLRRAIAYHDELMSADSLEAIERRTGRTPLHTAAAAGSLRALRVLIQTLSPARIAHVDARGATALHLAAGGDKGGANAPRPDAIAVLVRDCDGVLDVSARDVRLRTALHWAAVGSPVDAALAACEALLDELDERNRRGRGPTVAALLQERDASGRTALELAVADATRESIGRLLQSRLVAVSAERRIDESALAAAPADGAAKPPALGRASSGLEAAEAASPAPPMPRRFVTAGAHDDAFVRRRRQRVDELKALRARAAEGIALPDGPRRPPLGQCEWCFDDIEASHVFLPCGHTPVCAVCFLANAKAKLDTLPLRELTVRGSVYSCSHAGCDHYPSWRLTGPQLGGRDALLDVGEVTLALRAAAAALDADGAFDGGGDDDVAPARVLERWDHAVALAAAQERRERLHAQLQEDPAVRFCLDPHCQMHVIAADGGDDDGGVVSGATDEQRAALAIHSHSRGYTLDPKPLPPPLRRLKRLLTTPMSVGASLLVPVALALLVAAAAEGELIKEYVPLWQARRRVLGAALLLAALAAWQLGPRADRFALYDASAAHLARLRRELRDAHAALARANEQLGMRPVRAQMDRVRQVERAEDAVSAAEAAVEAEEALAATPELARDVGEPAGRVAFCPTCHRGQCFDCRLEWTPKGGGAMCHRGKSCEAMMSEAARRAKAKDEEARKAKAKAKREKERREREEELTEDFMKSQFDRPHSDSVGWKPCPKCGFAINKTGACLHMQCGACSCKFCWRCGSYNDGWRGTQNYTCGTGSCNRGGVRQWWTDGVRAGLPARSLLAVGSREEQFRALLRRDHGRANLGLLLLTGLALPLLLKVCADPDGCVATPSLAAALGAPSLAAPRRVLLEGSVALAACLAAASLIDLAIAGEVRAALRRERRRIGGALRRHRGAALAALLLALWFGWSERGAWRDLRSRRAGGELSPPLEDDVLRFAFLWLPYDFVGFLFGRDGIVWWLAVTAFGVAGVAVAVAAGLLLLLCCCCAAMLNERNRRPPPRQPPIRCPIQ